MPCAHRRRVHSRHSRPGTAEDHTQEHTTHSITRQRTARGREMTPAAARHGRSNNGGVPATPRGDGGGQAGEGSGRRERRPRNGLSSPPPEVEGATRVHDIVHAALRKQHPVPRTAGGHDSHTQLALTTHSARSKRKRKRLRRRVPGRGSKRRHTGTTRGEGTHTAPTRAIAPAKAYEKEACRLCSIG